MQPFFYTISLNNPLLSDVTLGPNEIFTDNGRIQPPSKQPSILSCQQSLVEQQRQQKINNRHSFLTRSSLSDDEPLTPKSANKHVFQLDHHAHYSKRLDTQQQYRFYHTELKIPPNTSIPPPPPAASQQQDILFDNSKMNLRRRQHNTDENTNQLDISTTTLSAGTGVHNNNDDEVDLLPDDFEIVRANITGITRAMQAFHVRELFWDEATANIKETKNKHKRHHTAPDQHVAHTAWTTTTTTIPTVTHGDTSNHKNFIAQQQQQPSIQLHTEQDLAIQQLVDNEKEHSTLRTKSTFTTLSSSELAEKEASIKPLWHPTDSLSDAPIPFYSNLLQQQHSWMDTNDDNDEDEALDQIDDDAWRRRFMGLMASLVKQSEHLEYLSTELLSAESHVRSLLSLASTVQDQFYEREKQYQDRLRECDVAGQQQSFMLASLDELIADLDMKSPQTATTPPTIDIPPEELKQRLSSSSSSSTTSSIQQQQPAFLLSKWCDHVRQGLKTVVSTMGTGTFVYKTRWRAGMLLGADVGTGDIIHVFQHPTDGIEMVIAGFGIIMGDTFLDQVSSGCTISSSSQHENMILHQYQVHLLPKDRKTAFVLLPKNRWMPDLFVDQCQNQDQVNRCPTRFTFFQRKHHCRRCGKIVCQRHSGNRLPLFKVDHVDQGKGCKWYRICDNCFIQAISSVSSY